MNDIGRADRTKNYVLTIIIQAWKYAKDYKYAHAYEGNFVDQEFLPEEIKGTKFYSPGDNAKENPINKRIFPYKSFN